MKSCTWLHQERGWRRQYEVLYHSRIPHSECPHQHPDNRLIKEHLQLHQFSVTIQYILYIGKEKIL
jgi:hypothetical protein